MKISPKECQEGRLTEEHLGLALQLLGEGGYVILEEVLPRAWIATMREAFDAELVRTDPTQGRGNAQAKGHGGCSAPLTMPFLDPLAVENPLGLQIIEAVMGRDVWAILPYHTNTAWPGSGVQHTHRDTQHLFPELPLALPPTLLVIHIPLVDCTEENGSTEVWPGTHLIPDPDPEATTPDRLAARAAQMPSLRTNMPAGSIVVRDMRVWHRGMPNRTQTNRTMLSIVYFRQLHRFPTHLVHLPAITSTAKQLLSERAQHLYRYNPVEAHES